MGGALSKTKKIRWSGEGFDLFSKAKSHLKRTGHSRASLRGIHGAVGVKMGLAAGIYSQIIKTKAFGSFPTLPKEEARI
jgi:hypothetical protein